MDKVLNQSEILDVMAEAYDLLIQHPIVEITKPIHRNPKEGTTDWIFECTAQVPYPNQENLPCKIPLCVSMPEAFPYAPVDIYPICKEVRGFPHQDAAGLRKLCLQEEHLAPQDASRLVCYVKWAIRWLEDAANGTLARPGDPYELPDFRYTFPDPPLPTKVPVIFEESSGSYNDWDTYIKTSGSVECFWGSGIQAIFAVRFYDKGSSLIRESEFTSKILSNDNKISGKWILIPNICYERHRPPKTYAEIVELCSVNGVDFYQNLRSAWNLENPCKFGIILIGFPIPKIIGQNPTEIHWQPLLFHNYDHSKGQRMKRSSRGQPSKRDRIWQKLIENGRFSLSKQLPWGWVENVARERLYVRGAHPPEVQSTSIAFLGCGALGSSVAELLVRGGVRQLNLFDYDSIKFGNLCRHTLDGSSVGSNKAVALAERLSRVNPLSAITGYPIGVPLNSYADETIRQVFTDTDVLVDCTTSATAFDWLNQYAMEHDKRLISLFFNLHAELLTICISGGSVPCGDIFRDLNRSVQHNQTPIDPDVYFYEPSEEEIIMEGAGCWHPSFPALNTHVQILAAHAVDIISYSINSKSQSGFAAIIERESVPQNGVQAGPLVKVAWKKEY